MAKRRRPGKNKPSHVEAVDSLIPARLPLEPSSNGPKDGLSAATDALESAAASLTHAASKPESFFQADEGVAKELTMVLQELFTFARQSEAQRKPFGPLAKLYAQGDLTERCVQAFHVRGAKYDMSYQCVDTQAVWQHPVHSFNWVDSESIWSQLELRNAPLEKHTRNTLARLLQSEDMSLAADIASDSEGDQNGHQEDGGGDGGSSNSNAISAGDDEEAADSNFDNDPSLDAEAKTKGREGGNKTLKPVSKGQDHEDEAKDRFFDADDMEKFADEGTMEDDMDDGMLDQMYGGGGGGAFPGEDAEVEEDSDKEEDAMMEDAIRQDAGEEDWEGKEEGDDKMGGGINHNDFFGGVSTPRPRKVSTSSKPSKSTRHRVQEEDDGEEYNDQEKDEQQDEDEDDETGLTGHGARSKRMKGKISDQEKELLAEKPWALRGEVHSHDRPQNSLLEATVDVERATRVAPPPTAELAMTLLDTIKKRCLDGNWDDVTPRDVQGPIVRKEGPHLSQDKSKEGLGELYEKEFMKQTMGVTEDDPQAGLKNDLKQLFAKLCGKLDSLCNFHYTPKAVVPEMKVQADVAAIAMEEVLPSSVADAEAVAPEEVYAKKRGRDAEFLEGGGEMAQIDRKRARSSKKAVRRKARRQAETAQKLVSKLNPGLANKYEKAKMLRDIQGSKNVTTFTGDEDSTGKEFSTSTKFFTQLQESVTATVKSGWKGAEADADGNGGKGKRAAQLRL
eukprot:jgi/Undpi1/151/HiC_scaffold_1.g00148.m1